MIENKYFPIKNGIVTYINDQNIAGFRAASSVLADNGVHIKAARVSPTLLNAFRRLAEALVRRSEREYSVIRLLLTTKGVAFIVIKPAEIVCLRPFLAVAIWTIAKIRGIEILCSWENCLWNLQEINTLSSNFGLRVGTKLLKAKGIKHFAASDSCASDVMRWIGIRARTVYQAPDVPPKLLTDGPAVPADPPYVINIATPRTRKGIDLFIRVAQLCVTSHPSVRFIWIGGQPAAEFQPMIEAANLGNRLIFISRVQPPFELIRYASAVAFTSRSEAFGQAVAESLAFGRTVVAFAGTGAEEVIGGTGFIVEAFDASSMASTILEVLKLPASRRISNTAWQRYETLFSPAAFASRFIEFLDCHEKLQLTQRD